MYQFSSIGTPHVSYSYKKGISLASIGTSHVSYSYKKGISLASIDTPHVSYSYEDRTVDIIQDLI